MEQEYWKKRWEAGQTGWDEKKPNALLQRWVARLGKPKRVLVPLAGKAHDLRFLAAQGHDVVGVEYVQEAIDAFFTDGKPTAHRLGAHDAYYKDGVTLVRSDIFDIKPESLGRFEAVYDRAALVAIDPARRDAYVQTLNAVNSGGTLLITFSYAEGVRQGPPFSVDDNEVNRLYPGKATKLEAIEDTLTEAVYWIGA